MRKKAEHLAPALEKAKKKGALIRIAVNGLEKNTIPKELKGVGEIRASHVAGRFVLLDGKNAILMTKDHNTPTSEDEAIWSNTPYLASALEKTFDDAWAKMKPVK